MLARRGVVPLQRGSDPTAARRVRYLRSWFAERWFPGGAHRIIKPPGAPGLLILGSMSPMTLIFCHSAWLSMAPVP